MNKTPMLINHEANQTCMEPMPTEKGMELTLTGGELTEFGAALVKKEQIHVFNGVPSILSVPVLRVILWKRAGTKHLLKMSQVI